jgi:hypothetical protein
VTVGTALLRASWQAVGRPQATVPAGAGLLLALLSVPLDDGYAVQVLRGVAVLLACAAAAATDDPAHELAAAAPYARPVRVTARAVVVLAPLAGIWVLAALVAVPPAHWGSVPALTLEAAGLCAGGLAVGTSLRAWRGVPTPSVLTIPAVASLALAAYSAPRAWALMPGQTWGPPWAAAHWRWAGVLLIAVAAACVAARDPWGPTGFRRGTAPTPGAPPSAAAPGPASSRPSRR